MPSAFRVPNGRPGMNGTIGPHPLAGLLPMLNEVELQALAADIREHGLRVPITLFEWIEISKPILYL